MFSETMCIEDVNGPINVIVALFVTIFLITSHKYLEKLIIMDNITIRLGTGIPLGRPIIY